MRWPTVPRVRARPRPGTGREHSRWAPQEKRPPWPWPFGRPATLPLGRGGEGTEGCSCSRSFCLFSARESGCGRPPGPGPECFHASTPALTPGLPLLVWSADAGRQPAWGREEVVPVYPGATRMKCHKPAAFKQHRCNLSQTGQSPKSRRLRGGFLLETPRDSLFPASSAPLVAGNPGVARLVAASAAVGLHVSSRCLFCVSPLGLLQGHLSLGLGPP